MKRNFITKQQIAIAIKNEVVKIKDTMPSVVRNVQVKIVDGKYVPAGMFEHVAETVYINPDDAMASATPIERLRFVLWHEYRHALQYSKGILKMKNSEIIWKNDRPVPINDVMRKLYLDGDSYNTLPWELDANAYAAENVPEYQNDHPFSAYKRKNVELRTLF